MRIFWKILLTFIVLPVAVVGIFYFLDQKGQFNLSHIEVFIDQDASTNLNLKSKLKAATEKLEKFQGVSLWKLDLEEVSSTFDDVGWVESFRISRQWPATLQVEMKPSPVYFVLLNSKGEFIPVIKKGLQLDPVGVAEWPDVPISRQSDFFKSQDLRAKAVDVLKHIPSRGPFARSQISEIHYEKKEGFSFTLIRDGVMVKVGENQIREKSLRISQVLHYLENKKFQARVIDANLSQKVLVRLRKDP